MGWHDISISSRTVREIHFTNNLLARVVINCSGCGQGHPQCM